MVRFYLQICIFVYAYKYIKKSVCDVAANFGIYFYICKLQT